MMPRQGSNDSPAGTLGEVTRSLPLVTTKLGPPRFPTTPLIRQRLLARLKSIDGYKLVVLKAAAGFGKTALLAHWYMLESQAGRRVAWLSLDEGDNHPGRFAQYLIASLEEVHANWSPRFQQLIQSEDPVPETVLYHDLINELASSKHDLYLVIDDYHCIHHQQIHDDLNFVLSRAPDNFHLLLGTREAPPLLLENLRSQGQLHEIADDDLRFTLEEARAYFAENTGLELDTADLQHLLQLTEGWAAGIQLTSLSPTIKSAPSETLISLSTGSRAISRYLQEIIFDQLDEETLFFLMQTSILERLCGPLCEAVTATDNGREALERLEARKLFLYALDDTGEWYRYHNLFANALRLKLRREKRLDKNELHRRASHWFSDNGYWGEAIRHALAADEIHSTLPAAEQSAEALAEEGDVDTLVDWLNRLPAEIGHIGRNCQFALIYGLIHRFQLEEAQQLIDQLDSVITDDSQGEDRRVLVETQLLKAISCAAADDSAAAMALCEPLLAELPLHSKWMTGLACNLGSWCYIMESRYEKMDEILRYSPFSDQSENQLFITVYRRFLKGLRYLRQAQLDQALTLISEALDFAEKHAGPESTAAVSAAPFLTEIYYERNEWEQIDILLTPRAHLIDRLAMVDGRLRSYVAFTREALFLNDPHRAEELIEHGLQQAVQHRWHRLQAALLHEQVRFHLSQGDSDRADTALQQLDGLWRQLHTDKHCTLGEINHYLLMARARTLTATGQSTEIAAQLTPLLTEQEQLGNRMLAIRLRILLALAQFTADETSTALNTLLPALLVAEQQGILRSFVDEGEPMRRLLRAALGHDADVHLPQTFIDTLLTNFNAPAPDEQQDKNRISVLQNAILHQLSRREQDTLSMAAKGQSNKVIARSLDISPETVKWHLKNIYIKLDVSGRVQAIGKAQELRLLH
jgi:LuxR family maltose regulon positive regulatory protein